MVDVAKIIELVGSSEKGWSEAAQEVLYEAKKTIDRCCENNRACGKF